MPNIYITKVNEVFIKVISDDVGVEWELASYFEYFVPNYRFMPSYKSGIWDGKIRLYNKSTKNIYYGLLNNIRYFAEKRNYSVIIHPDLKVNNPFTLEDAAKFIKSLDLPFSSRYYQIEAFLHAVQSNRKTFLCPTASGKSLIIYMLARYFKKKTLIIVPTISLVHQMHDDFKTYSKDPNFDIHKIYMNQDKNSDKLITVSTWQSLYKEDEKFFRQFDVVLGDEVHTFKSTCLINIMVKLERCKYRFGFTGTLDGSLTNEKVIAGLFGPVEKIITTKKLIEEKHLSDFKIKCLVFKYSDEERKLVKDYKYIEELQYLISHSTRNENIKRLAISAKGNTLVLFQYVEKHGKILYDLIKSATDRPVYFVSGEVDGEIRNEIRKAVEKMDNAIIVASIGVFSVGINITSLRNIIFASPSKSKIRTLQSIGRVLRKSENKTESILYDISDDLGWKKKDNFTYKHFGERLKIYNQEKFDYKIYSLNFS